MQFEHETYEVTALRPSPDKIHLAVGYANGAVKLFNLPEQTAVCDVAVHRTAVNVLRFDEIGLKLVSGGLDTDLVLIDIVAQIGVCRLRGHTAPVTDCCFYAPLDNILISSSKDTQIKFWNLNTQTCFRTIVDHRSDVWRIALLRNGQYMVAGSSDKTLNVYIIQQFSETNDRNERQVKPALDDIDLEDTMSPISINLAGTIQRIGKGRTVNLLTDSTAQVLACHGTDDTIELFYFCTHDETMRRLDKRLKKLAVTNPMCQHKTDSSTLLTMSDEIRRLASIKVGGGAATKIKSIDLLIGVQNEMRLIATTGNNAIRLFSMNISRKRDEANLVKAIMHPGHHSEVRSLAFSSDGLSIASGSSDSLKLWNRRSLACIRTVEQTGHILCLCFVPGDRHVLVGLKTGNLLIVDIVTGDIVEQIAAHTKELWAITVLPDLKGCITGGGDATVKLWSFELIAATQSGESSDNHGSTLSLLHRATHKLEEAVLCVSVSANNKFIAVGMLDSTVKVFFLDSFRFYLSLYGHKLPVLCMDISDDSALIVTGSADRNVKIWGMDFGNCHRSLFGHDDSVMAVRFVAGTHMFWTCGKDGRVKQWDGDTFVKIRTLDGHIGEAYSLAVAPGGTHLVSCGSDHVLRMYERNQEPIVLQDIQEEEREAIERHQLATGDDTIVAALPNLKLPSQKTIGAERGAEAILECLKVGRRFDGNEDNVVPPIMQAYQSTTSLDYLTAVLAAIRTSDLEESLVLLPFAAVTEMLVKIPAMIADRRDHIELVCKVVLFLFRIHQKPIVGNQTLLPMLQPMIAQLQIAICKHRDVIGENHFGFQLLQRDIEMREGVELFRDATRTKKQKDKRNKRQQLTKRLFIQMN